MATLDSFRGQPWPSHPHQSLKLNFAKKETQSDHNCCQFVATNKLLISNVKWVWTDSRRRQKDLGMQCRQSYVTPPCSHSSSSPASSTCSPSMLQPPSTERPEGATWGGLRMRASQGLLRSSQVLWGAGTMCWWRHHLPGPSTRPCAQWPPALTSPSALADLFAFMSTHLRMR